MLKDRRCLRRHTRTSSIVGENIGPLAGMMLEAEFQPNRPLLASGGRWNSLTSCRRLGRLAPSLVGEEARLDVARQHAWYNFVHLPICSDSTGVRDVITMFAGREKLNNIGFKALHDRHAIFHCFENCRNIYFTGKRESDERVVFKHVVNAFNLSL